MEWGLLINISGLCAAIIAPIAVAVRFKKIAYISAFTALGYTTLTIIGVILEWHSHYWDLGSDIPIFGFFAVVTAISGAGSLMAIRNKKTN
jgi:hypothetical protein